VEIRDDPELHGKPVIIGADPKGGKGRGVVSTCNYEARKYGLYSGIPISQAYKKCPHGTYLHPNFSKYSEASKKVMNILRQYSPHFQQVGSDEAYLDVSETCSNLNEVRNVAKQIQNDILEKVGITISIGCASSKSIAKIASDQFKPNGITLVNDGMLKEFLSDLEITRIPGIGKKSKIILNKKGIKKIGDIIDLPLNKIVKIFGKHGKWIFKVINGYDMRKVQEYPIKRKSISKERTFYHDTDDFNTILSKFEEINDSLDKTMVKHNIMCKTITLKIRFEGYLTHSRSKTLLFPIRDKATVLNVVLGLYKEFLEQNKKVRLIGIKLSNLRRNIKVKQESILDYALIALVKK
jgi:DNA polymerase IV (DinB-like DNA polymerase)